MAGEWVAELRHSISDLSGGGALALKPRLIALDIDGTLIPPGAAHTALPDPDLSQAVAGLLQSGVIVVLATGRMFPGTARIARHLGTQSPMICQQGASVHGLDGTLLSYDVIDAQIAQELAQFALQAGWPYAWFDAQRYLVSSPNPVSQFFGEVSGIAVEHHAAPQFSDVLPCGVDIISTREHANDVHNQLADRYGERVQLLDFPSVTAVHSARASKGNALALLAQTLGVERDETLAIGDSANDASMLRWAGHGATPAHCDHYARQAADEVLSGDGVDGVTELLQRLLINTSH